MSDLPAHSSPILAPFPRPSAQYLSNWSDLQDHHPSTPSLPDNLISPAFTPPATPGLSTPSRHAEPKSTPVDTTVDIISTKQPRLVERLPHVECVVRACIPTTTGSEMFLYLYQNDIDNKEHLAIVFGNNIRSRSLDAERPGETEMDRMIRGAYVGRLHPGRLSSRVDNSPKRKRPVDGPRRQRSGSALKNVTSAPENGALPSEDAEPTDGAEQDHLTPETTITSHPSALRAPMKPTLPLVRVHSECYTGETAWSARCDCGEQLDEAARLMASSPTGGVIVYLRQEGRGIGLSEKLKAYNLQDLGNDTVEANLLLRHPADKRSYGLATAILVDLGLGVDGKGEGGIRLLTNNPEKVRAVEGPGREVRVRERVAMVPLSWRTKGERGVQGKELEAYLRTKIGRMGHMIGPDG